MYNLTLSVTKTDIPIYEEQFFAFGASSVSISQKDGQAELCGFFMEKSDALKAVKFLKCDNYSLNRIAADWNNKWLESVQSFQVTNSLFVKQCGTQCQGGLKTKHVIELDARDTFGLGSHPTSSLCASFLEEIATSDNINKNFIELGAGSGILMIYAALLGFSSVNGCEIDKDACCRANTNMKANNLTSISVINTGLDDFLKNRKADIVIANIPVVLLEKYSSIINSSVNKNGLLILSGFTTERFNEIQKLYGAGLLLDSHKQKEGWSAVLYTNR